MPVGCGFREVDVADEDVVVAARVDGVDVAADPGGRALDDRADSCGGGGGSRRGWRSGSSHRSRWKFVVLDRASLEGREELVVSHPILYYTIWV